MTDLLSLEDWNKHYEKAAMRAMLDAVHALTYGQHDEALRLLQKAQHHLDSIAHELIEEGTPHE